ncbi:hypothetical protein BJF81_14575 [Ornithinimicrobium sp. CNJ-824]|uniref:hypothetical protein n=1 Tax=Ornithinimicrobium sp. CNJ-824 TaxID=1904966 RepID=UPI00095BF3FE|nr:hypothetical protein [Ornithinimicrobium sp. CNJ-824]OLT21847.1 hypothetical protein BJF81_14575 [Ornithinimicrobium sp. CNJ-824]
MTPGARPRARAARATLAAAAVALALSGCAQQEVEEPDPPPVVDAVPDDEAEATSADTGPLPVETVSDRGIVLVTTSVVLSGESSPITGQLVTGPGGCLALDRQGPPALLVLPEGTELSAGNRPSVTWGDVTIEVGGPLQLDAVAVPLDRFEGLPDGCGEGAAGAALVVSPG